MTDLLNTRNSIEQEEYGLRCVSFKISLEIRVSTRETRESSEDKVLKVHQKPSTNANKGNCFFCKKPGHIKSECTKYKSWKARQESSNKVAENTENKDVCFFTQCKQNTNDEACLSINSEKSSWILDSGASSHMVQSREFFDQFNKVRDRFVYLADGAPTEVKGIGSGAIKCDTGEGNSSKLIIKDVLYIPQLSSNLLSVRKLTKEGYEVIFKDNSCKIFFGGKVKAVASAPTHSDLYRMSTGEQAYAAVSKVVKTTGDCNGHLENCQHVWHRLFGHRHPGAIKELLDNDMADGLQVSDCGRRKICEYCLRGKMAWQPFPKESKIKSKAVLDLLNTDLCGPMQTVTPSGKKYVLTLIDDYSRYCIVNFLATKDEVTQYMKQSIAELTTKFEKTPKCVRSDRGREYVNKGLKEYLRNKGIKFQYTAPYSAPQNGVAERKNRSLVEMARCMLADANMEKKFWAEAVNTANFFTESTTYQSKKNIKKNTIRTVELPEAERQGLAYFWLRCLCACS